MISTFAIVVDQSFAAILIRRLAVPILEIIFDVKMPCIIVFLYQVNLSMTIKICFAFLSSHFRLPFRVKRNCH